MKGKVGKREGGHLQPADHGDHSQPDSADQCADGGEPLGRVPGAERYPRVRLVAMLPLAIVAGAVCRIARR